MYLPGVGSSAGWVKQKTMKLVFAASPLRTQHEGVRAKTNWLRIKIMCQSGATCLPIIEVCWSSTKRPLVWKRVGLQYPKSMPTFISYQGSLCSKFRMINRLHLKWSHGNHSVYRWTRTTAPWHNMTAKFVHIQFFRIKASWQDRDRHFIIIVLINGC